MVFLYHAGKNAVYFMGTVVNFLSFIIKEHSLIHQRSNLSSLIFSGFQFSVLKILRVLLPTFLTDFPQAYHSKLNNDDTPVIGNIAFLPIRTTVKGPAPRTGMRYLNVHVL